MDMPANDQLTEALSQVIAETEAILAALEGDADPGLGALRQRVQQSVEAARARLADIENEPQRPLERAISAAERWVQDNPWTTVALCAGAGLLAGLLVGRRVGRRVGSGARAGADAR